MPAFEPYVGPRPFDKEDAGIFFGRDSEAAELLSLVIAHPVVLLYSQSGAGKTSLLNAELIPMLEGRGVRVLGPGRVGGHASERLVAAVKNVYLANLCLTLQRTTAPGMAAFSADTVGALVDALLPKADLGEQDQEPLRVVILDQVEEIFTAFPERWQEREALLDQIGEALEQSMRLRVVLALREEYLAAMMPYAGVLPGRLRGQLRLERLRRPDALKAILDPLQKTNRQFAPGAAEKLVDNLLKVPGSSSSDATLSLSGEYVEPLHLQVVCQTLWRSLPADVTTIDEERIAAYGDVDRALLTYYEDCLRDVLTTRTVTEAALRAWFETKLITPVGTRAIVYKDTATTAGMANAVVERLEQLRLVRPELRGSAVWYELTHDRLIGPIRAANEQWRRQLGAGSALQEFIEKRVAAWASQGGGESALLSPLELEGAEDWLRHDGAAHADDPQLKEFIQASRIAATRAKTNRLRIGLTVAVLLLLVALASAIVAWRARMDERQARREAENATMRVQGEIASQYAAQSGKEFDALLFGLRAVQPGLQQRGDPPEAALKGLDDALKAVGPGLWLRGSASPVKNLAFSPDGRRVLTVAGDGLRVWQTETGEQMSFHAFPQKPDMPEGFGDLYWWLPSGNRIAWRVSRGIPRAEARGGTTELQFRIAFMDPLTGKILDDWDKLFADSMYLAVPRRGTQLAAATRDLKTIQIRNADTGLVNHVIRVASPLTALEISADGSRIAAGTETGMVGVWETSTGQSLFSVTAQAKVHLNLSLSPRGGRMVAWNSRGNRVYHLDERKDIGKLAGSSIQYITVVSETQALVDELFSSGRAVALWTLVPISRVKQFEEEWADGRFALAGNDLVYYSYHSMSGDPKQGESRGEIRAFDLSTLQERIVASNFPKVFEIAASGEAAALGLVAADGRVRILKMNAVHVLPPQGDIKGAAAQACRILRSQPEWKEAASLCQGSESRSSR